MGTKVDSAIRRNRSAARRPLIKRAQNLGITLKEIGGFLKLGDGQCEDVFELANRKHAWIEKQITDLK